MKASRKNAFVGASITDKEEGEEKNDGEKRKCLRRREERTKGSGEEK